MADACVSLSPVAAEVLAPAGRELRGGDFAVMERHGARTVLVVGDVEGHGGSVAADADMVSGLFREASAHVDDPCALLDIVNEALRHRLGDRYVTAVVATFDADAVSLEWASAGHVPPFWLDTGAPVDGVTPGLPLGVADELGCTSAVLQPVPPGHGIVFVTDGVEDVRDPSGERFGAARVTDAVVGLCGCAAATVVERLKAEVCSFGSGELPDDVCIVAVRFEPADSAPGSDGPYWR